MKLSIIIPTLNEQAFIQRALQSAWRAGAEEVVVADGGSSDATLELIGDAGRLVRSPRGRATQQNQAAAAARGDVLLFLHADNWFAGDVVGQMRRALSDSCVAGGCFQQAIDDPRRVYRWLEWGNGVRARWRQLPYGDQGIFVRRSAFERVGGFPNVALMEDVMLCQKLRRLGKLALLPGPLHVSARRWQNQGVLRQTLRNWALLAAFQCGVAPDRLARFYPP